MVPQEPAPLPVRPKLDFEAGPVTGASLATGQIPVIDPQAGQTVQGRPVEQTTEQLGDTDEEEPEKPQDNQLDDAAWTASLKIIDESEWTTGPGAKPSGWAYPQIFGPGDPPSPISGIGPFTGSSAGQAAGQPAGQARRESAAPIGRAPMTDPAAAGPEVGPRAAAAGANGSSAGSGPSAGNGASAGNGPSVGSGPSVGNGSPAGASGEGGVLAGGGSSAGDGLTGSGSPVGNGLTGSGSPSGNGLLGEDRAPSGSDLPGESWSVGGEGASAGRERTAGREGPGDGSSASGESAAPDGWIPVGAVSADQMFADQMFAGSRSAGAPSTGLPGSGLSGSGVPGGEPMAAEAASVWRAVADQLAASQATGELPLVTQAWAGEDSPLGDQVAAEREAAARKASEDEEPAARMDSQAASTWRAVADQMVAAHPAEQPVVSQTDTGWVVVGEVLASQTLDDRPSTARNAGNQRNRAEEDPTGPGTAERAATEPVGAGCPGAGQTPVAATRTAAGPEPKVDARTSSGPDRSEREAAAPKASEPVPGQASFPDRGAATNPRGLSTAAVPTAPDKVSDRVPEKAPERVPGRGPDKVTGPPTAPTTQLPLRREMRDRHTGPVPIQKRAKTVVRVLKGALGRRRPRSHRGSADSKTLGSRFKSKENHLGLIRLTLALTVGVTHATEIGYGWQPEFVHTQLGELCVDAFFVLSGFLLVGSYLRLDSVRRYTWHRFLRIMPGFWVCLVVSATLLAPLLAWLQGVPVKSLVEGNDSAVDYVIRNAALLMRQWGISGLPSDVEMAGVLNGSLWTLFYEATCYASIIALGLCGGLRRRPVMTVGAVGALWVVTVLNDYQIIYVGQERILRLSFMFLIGSVLYLYAHHVPMNRWLTLGSIATVVAGIAFFDDYRVLAGPAFGYLCLALAVSRVRLPEPRTDISYGLYVYHWPLLQALNLVGVAAYGIWVFAPAGLAVASIVALVSWRLVEKPALGFKDAGWVTWQLPVARPATSQARV